VARRPRSLLRASPSFTQFRQTHSLRVKSKRAPRCSHSLRPLRRAPERAPSQRCPLGAQARRQISSHCGGQYRNDSKVDSASNLERRCRSSRPDHGEIAESPEAYSQSDHRQGEGSRDHRSRGNSTPRDPSGLLCGSRRFVVRLMLVLPTPSTGVAAVCPIR
jgi:hypothetical protein